MECDVTRINFLRYESGSVSLSIKEQNDLGKKDIEKLMDIENKWEDSIKQAKVAVPVLEIELEEFKSAFKDMKNWKATCSVIDCVSRNVEGWWFFSK